MTTSPALLARTAIALLAFVFLPAGQLLAGPESAAVNVGIRGRLEQVVLPGPELEVKPQENREAPFVLRIENTYPHGSAYRYDFVYYALEPGRYDLTRYLRPRNPAEAVKLPPVEVEVKSLLAPGMATPHALEAKPAGWFATYRPLLFLLGAFWLLGLYLILTWGRRRRDTAGATDAKPVTIADRLRPLVVEAMNGTMTPGQQAELERTLYAYWRRKLHLEDEKPAEALNRLREHPQAGGLLKQLEVWLHHPNPDRKVDLGELLKPYQEAVSPDAVDPAGEKR